MAQKFEELECWKLAVELDRDIFLFVSSTAIKKDFGLVNQMLRASGSVADNIAEGFERNGNKEFLNFLFIAKGSCGELRSQMHRAMMRGHLSNQNFELFAKRCRINSVKIMRLINSVSNSGFVGQKYYERSRLLRDKGNENADPSTR